ncbi:MAG: aldo/keto reductase [Acidimicrobiales bacterium]
MTTDPPASPRPSRLGAGGPPVTRLGLGLAALGRPAYITTARAADLGGDRSVGAMAQRSFAALDAAYAAGVRYVDTARSYGRAEEFLADWLSSRDVGDVTVGSKWGYRYVGAWRMEAPVHETKDHSLEAFVAQWAQTSATLGDAVAVYQVHSATFDTGVLGDTALHRELACLRERGVIPGVTVSGPRQAELIEKALSIEVDGLRLFGSVQATWNVLERSAEAALAAAHDDGVGVIVKEVLANGRLSDDGDPSAAPSVRDHARRTGLDTATVALAVALTRPWVDVVLSGAVTTRQVHAGARAVSVAIPTVLVDADPAETPDGYWATRAAREWA